GRAKGVQIDGLLVPAMIRRLGQLPLIGYFVRLSIALVRLPKLVRDQREFGSYLLSQNEQIADFINATSERLTDAEQWQKNFESVAGTYWDDLKERIAASRA